MNWPQRFVGVLACVGALSIPSAAGSAGPEELREWTRAMPGDNIRADGPLIFATAGKSWVRTRRDAVDFVVRFEFRFNQADTRAAVYVRAWSEYSGMWPQTGYRIALSGVTTGSDGLGAVRGFSKKVTPVPGEAPESPGPVTVGGWHKVEIVCEGDTVSVRIDGRVVSRVEGREPLAGSIGVECASGAIDFRAFTLEPLRTGVVYCEAPPGDDAKEPAGFVGPRLLKRVRPRFPIEAFERRELGTVVFDAVIERDGAVGATCVRRSDSPRLDAEALAAVRRWRFQPARVSGSPVQSKVRFEVSFKAR